MMKFITGGGLRIDYLITHEGQAYTGLMGGNALYAAVGAAVWADNVGLWARAGRNYPQPWLDDLATYGLQAEGVIRLPGPQDHRTFYAYTPDGRRDDTNPALHFARIGQSLPQALGDYTHSTPGQDLADSYEPLALRPEDWQAAWSAGAAGGFVAVHLSPLALSTHLHLPAYLREKGVAQITLDPGERYMTPDHLPHIRRFLGKLNAFLPSDQEVRSLFGPEIELWEAAEALHRWGAPIVVIKNGANGVLLHAGGRRTHLPAFHKPGDGRVLDVTGAGDAFCGGFMVGLAQTADPLEAARMGLVSASFVIEAYGALSALGRSRAEARQRLTLV